jgi:UDP-GlcNAc3NAcA epimerase
MPEELNRVVADHLSSIVLVPTIAAEADLQREGVSHDQIHLVGDVMYDAVLQFGAKAERESTILRDVGAVNGKYVLATVHRPENVDKPENLRAILEGIRRIAEESE